MDNLYLQEEAFLVLQRKLTDSIAAGNLDNYFQAAWEGYSLTKKPDSAYSFYRYFSAIENATLQAYWWDWKGITVKVATAIGDGIERLTPQLRRMNKPHIFLMAGNSSLANAQILYEAISSLDSIDRQALSLVLIDEVRDDRAKEIRDRLNVPVVCLGGNSFAMRRLIALYMVVALTRATHVHFWSIPVDLPILSLALRRLRGDLYLSHTTTKYSYPFRKLMIDNFVTSPGLEYYPREKDYAASDFYAYPQRELEAGELTENDIAKIKLIESYRADGGYIITSFARPEKLTSSSYTSLFDYLPVGRRKYYYLLFGVGEPSQNLIEALDRNNICLVQCGFCSLPNYCKCVDLYIDPVPHGGGYSLMLSAFHGIPSLIPLMYSENSKNPSGINSLLLNPEASRGLEVKWKGVFHEILARDDSALKSFMNKLVDEGTHMERYSEFMRDLYKDLVDRPDRATVSRVLLGMG